MSSPERKLVRRILVIDDNPAIHQDFRKILSGENADTAQELGEMAAAIFGQDKAPAPRTRKLHYNVVCASQGQEGLAKVQSALEQGVPFQLAFVDIRMPPGWDGIETIERLWKADPDLQTVICSAYSDYSWADILNRLGESDRLLILKKPFDTAEICQMAAALTEKYRLSQMAKMKMDELEAIVEQRAGALKEANRLLEVEVQQRREAEERLRHDVFHDRLTGLPNRVTLADRIEHCIKRQQRDPGYHFAVLFMDMDDFKVINDSLGHEAGDELLTGVAQRLNETIRAVDLATRFTGSVPSRLGGDEFVVLLEGLTNPEDARLVADRIEQAIVKPFALDGYEVVAHVSMGIAVGSPRYTRAADLLRDADTAVHQAKARGKRGHAVFDTTMHTEARDRLELEMDFRKAVGTDQFSLHYQPIISLLSGKLEGFEALVRWNHPKRGSISPARFIPLAEATGLIVPLGMQILRDAARQIKQWREQFSQDHPALWVAVNLSGKQLQIADFPDQVESLIAELSLDRSALHLEITESIVMQPGDAALATLARLHQNKFFLSMDDFGTGYSSLSSLHHLPLSSIKVDQSFVKKMNNEGRSYVASVQAVVMLAHNCGFTVVAEGVETFEQLAQLQALDCDYAQGYYFSRPVIANAVPDLLSVSMMQFVQKATLRQAG